jgi:hypothetical protein
MIIVDFCALFRQHKNCVGVKWRSLGRHSVKRYNDGCLVFRGCYVRLLLPLLLHHLDKVEDTKEKTGHGEWR